MLLHYLTVILPPRWFSLAFFTSLVWTDAAPLLLTPSSGTAIRLSTMQQHSITLMLRVQPSQFLPESNIKHYDVYHFPGKFVVFCPILCMNGLCKKQPHDRAFTSLSISVHTRPFKTGGIRVCRPSTWKKNLNKALPISWVNLRIHRIHWDVMDEKLQPAFSFD